jgi:pimeloyl-ACP methyl ester carboxylesterase
MIPSHFIAFAVAVLTAGSAAAQGVQPGTQSQAPASNLLVFLQGAPVGGEQVTVTQTSDGWTIKGTGRLGNPINLTTTRFEVKYVRDWRPSTLDVEASLRGQPMVMHTVFADGVATSDVMQGGTSIRKADKVATDTIVLPNMLFAAYEALALRLSSVKPPAELRVYVAPQAEIVLRVTAVADERIRTVAGIISARRFSVTFANPSGPLPAEVWIDQDSRLLRFRVPAQGLEVARDDVAAVSSRVERIPRSGDEQVSIHGNGFVLAGTLSKPAASAPVAPKAKAVRLPAVVLIAVSGAIDRDAMVVGIPIFAQIANRLADAGFIVVRYDKRGVGQSGGRGEAATVQDYAEDAHAVVEFLRARQDVDPNRIALVGHSEGGFVGALAASKAGKRVAALVLIATPGTTGADLVLEQQRHQLERMSLPEAEQTSRITLQQAIQKAVVTGQGWETIPPAYRRQADSPWFRSFLLFDPARVVPKLPQPILVIQGNRDRQVAARHGELLRAMAASRKGDPGAYLVVVEDVNHLLVPATTGELDEYPTLEDRNVSVKVLDALVSWLKGKIDVAAPRPGQ